MKKTSQFFPFVFTLLAAVASLTSARADVLFTFSQLGANVVATTSGSILTPFTGISGGSGNADFSDAFSLGHVTAGWQTYNGGIASDSSLMVSFNSASGPAFGYSGDRLYVTDSTFAGRSFTPSNTFTWNNQTVAEIFSPTAPLSTTPRVVYTASNGEKISFVQAVPEPSTWALLGVGALGFVWQSVQRRRRSTSRA
jgi:hypothetical protein